MLFGACQSLALNLPTLGGYWEEAPSIIGAATWTRRLLVIKKQMWFRHGPLLLSLNWLVVLGRLPAILVRS